MSTADIHKTTKKIERARARIDELTEHRLDAVVAAMRTGDSLTACALACGVTRQSLTQQLEERRPEFMSERAASVES